MTYCVGVLLVDGIVLASDSRTHAGVDDVATFCKMTVFERAGDRVIVLLSSGNLAATQAVISILKQRGEQLEEGVATLWTARTMFDVAILVSEAMREVERSPEPFNASFIIGGQIKGERHRLFRTFAEGNFIEAAAETPFFQTGESKYGRPIIDPVLTPSTTLSEAMKCVLVAFDSAMRSNLSVGMPIDLVCCERDSLKVSVRQRFEPGDTYFSALSTEWRKGVRAIFRRLPAVPIYNIRPLALAAATDRIPS
jgi:putative proteasome-type protease